jgi:hypothetical protein
MASFCLSMLTMATELAITVPAWDEAATKFLEHFLSIANAVRAFGSGGVYLWDEQDGFCYDVLVRPDGSAQPLRARSMVGLLPLLAVAHVPTWAAEVLPGLTDRLRWLAAHRPEELAAVSTHGSAGDRMLSLLGVDRVQRVLQRMFDPEEFLSPHGIRALSAAYRTPFVEQVDGRELSIDYEPGESRTPLFGGNSNWRGPVWLPANVLLADALRCYDEFLGADVSVEVPTGSGQRMRLAAAADEIDRRVVSLFRRGPDGRRPCDGERIEACDRPVWRDHVTFSEYFHGDTGEGLGASHQTGWTALVAHLLCRPEVT